MKDTSKELYTFSVQTVKDIYENVSPLEYQVEDLIHKGSLNIVSGDPKVGKSIFVTEMAKCLARGEMFLDTYQCSKSKVLVVDADNGVHSIRNRLEGLGFERDEENFVLHNAPAFKIDKEEVFLSLKEYIISNSIEVVVFDSLVRIHDKEENLASDMSLVMGKLREISSLGVTVIVIHHSGKSFEGRGNAFRGSQDIIASVDSAYEIKRGKDSLVFKSRFRRDGADNVSVFYERVDSFDGTFNLVKIQDSNSQKVNKKELAKSAILEILREKAEGVYVQDILSVLKEKHDIGEKNARDAVSELRDGKEVVSEHGLNNKEKLRI